MSSKLTGRAGRALLTLLLPAAPLRAQRAAQAGDSLGVTACESGVAVSRLRADVAGSLAAREVEAHEAVHRRQAAAFPICEAWLASLTSTRRVIEAELPAYCAQ